MHRETNLRFLELWKKKKPGTSKNRLAKALKISDATLGGYLDNSWTKVEREVLERFADFVECEVGEVFTTIRSPFWDAFSHNADCYSLQIDIPLHGGETEHRDNSALDIVYRLIKDCEPSTRVFKKFVATEAGYRALAAKNLVVVGSPKHNPAAEFALVELFGKMTHSPDPTEPPPFQFVWHPSMDVQVSAFCRTANQREPCGIWLRDENAIVAADFEPDGEKFQAAEITEGRDCAAIVVMNQSTSGSTVARKLIVLAGFTRIGTEAAADRLFHDFRDLEPRKDGCVWGIVEAIYTKDAGKLNREIVRADWRYRVDGRSPIKFKEKPIRPLGGSRQGHGRARRRLGRL